MLGFGKNKKELEALERNFTQMQELRLELSHLKELIVDSGLLSSLKEEDKEEALNKSDGLITDSKYMEIKKELDIFFDEKALWDEDEKKELSKEISENKNAYPSNLIILPHRKNKISPQEEIKDESIKENISLSKELESFMNKDKQLDDYIREISKLLDFGFQESETDLEDSKKLKNKEENKKVDLNSIISQKDKDTLDKSSDDWGSVDYCLRKKYWWQWWKKKNGMF